MEQAVAELQGLIDREIPDGRQQLESSYSNLERVAAFCEANYHQAENKAAALAETQRYTVQSLASVAYQINTLTSNFLAMLDLQADKIAHMESEVDNIAQLVDSHKEKVARREIGALTANKVPGRMHKIVAPPVGEKPQRYVRRPIDYSLFDDLGHGVKVSGPAAPLGTLGRGPDRDRLARTASNISGGSSGSGASGQAWMDPRYGQPTHIAGRGSLSKASAGPLRQPQLTHPPQPPPMDHRYSGYPGSADVSRSSLQSASTVTSQQSYSAVNVPPPPPLGPLAVSSQPQRMSMNEGFMDQQYGQHSPPLPPPPEPEGGGGIYGSYMATSSAIPDWVPSHFIEKVVAIYDYQAEKPDELSFVENSVIYVLKKNEDGWYEGVLDGATGLFPGNYVESCM